MSGAFHHIGVHKKYKALDYMLYKPLAITGARKSRRQLRGIGDMLDGLLSQSSSGKSYQSSTTTEAARVAADDRGAVGGRMAVDIPVEADGQGPVTGRVAADELAYAFFKNEHLASVFLLAFRSEKIGPERLEREFRRLLKPYSIELRERINDNDQRVAVQLVRSRARHIANAVRRIAQATTNPDQPDIMKHVSNETWDRRRLVDQFLEDRTSKPAVSRSNLDDYSDHFNLVPEGEINKESESECGVTDDEGMELKTHEQFPRLSRV